MEVMMTNPEPVPAEYMERLGLRFYFDTNFITDDSPAAERLRDLHRDGWINLWRTDTVDTELGDAKDEDRRRELLGASAPYVESLGVGVFDHSRFDHAVFGNDDDAERLDRVYRILFPGSDRHDDMSGRVRRKIRDAMHVATAIRYGSNGFITRDDEDLVVKTDEIAEAFDWFRIMTPEDALALVERMRERYEVRNRP